MDSRAPASVIRFRCCSLASGEVSATTSMRSRSSLRRILSARSSVPTRVRSVTLSPRRARCNALPADVPPIAVAWPEARTMCGRLSGRRSRRTRVFQDAGPATNTCAVIAPSSTQRKDGQWKDGEMAGNVSTPGASVTSRALALVGAFDEDHRRLSLSDLAGRAGLPVATAHRLVGELVAWGALSRTATGEYVVGRRLWDVGLLAPVQTGLRQLASPYLHDLYGATLATVQIGVRDGSAVLYLDRLAGHASVPVVSSVGSRL